MALFTGKGDKGTTKIFGCDQRFSKSSAVAEALGSVDELNSFLGLCKVRAKEKDLVANGRPLGDILRDVQHDLFIVQAQLAGAPKKMTREKVDAAGDLVNAIEKELPPIKSFFISGGTELAALLDTARTLARRAERTVVAYFREKNEGTTGYGENPAKPDLEIPEALLAYLNRLSSLLYALARLANHKSGITEEPPHY